MEESIVRGNIGLSCRSGSMNNDKDDGIVCCQGKLVSSLSTE